MLAMSSLRGDGWRSCNLLRHYYRVGGLALVQHGRTGLAGLAFFHVGSDRLFSRSHPYPVLWGATGLRLFGLWVPCATGCPRNLPALWALMVRVIGGAFAVLFFSRSLGEATTLVEDRRSV